MASQTLNYSLFIIHFSLKKVYGRMWYGGSDRKEIPL